MGEAPSHVHSADALYYFTELEELVDELPIGGVALPNGAPEKGPLLAIVECLRATLFDVSSREELNPTPRFLTDEQVERLPPVKFLVEGLIPLGAAAELHGPPGSGKSFLALALACAVATGRGFFGHAVQRGPVVYVVGEGLGGISGRLRAWKDEYGPAGSVGLHFSNGPVQLLDKVDVTRFIARVKELPVPPSLIVLDTLARCMVGGDENSAKDMGLAVAAIDRIRVETSAASLIVHHTGKNGESERGSSALRGALDTMLALKNDAGRITVECEKQKDAAEFPPMILRLKPVGASCTLVTLTTAWEEAPRTLTTKHHQALTSLSRDFLPDGATCTQWMKACKLPESSFYRCRTELVERGYVAAAKKGAGEKYTVTAQGREVLTPNSHEAFNELSRAGHNSLSASRSPLGGESSGSDSQVVAWETA